MIWERPCFREECSFRDQLPFLVAFLLTGAFWKANFQDDSAFAAWPWSAWTSRRGRLFRSGGALVCDTGNWASFWQKLFFWNDMKLFMYILLKCDFLYTGDAFIFQTVRVSYWNFLIYNAAKILSCFSWSQMCMFIFSAGSVVYYLGQNTGIILRTL